MNLARAMDAFVKADCDRSLMDVSAWALTYHSTPEAVRSAWEAAASRHSLQQHHNGEEQE